MREYEVSHGGAWFQLALEWADWQRPTGTHYGRFMARAYVPIHYDEDTETITCRGSGAWWL